MESISNQIPIYKVFAMMNWKPEEIFERRVNNIEIVPNSANGWVWITAWNDRVAIS
tara:strand:- start:127 stop:294 length:168 start_codon:yes stop_codon:yes gene_type:complete